MNNCQKLEPMIPDYLSGQLDGAALADFNRLLADCPQYRDELVKMEAVWLTYSQTPPAEPSAALGDRFHTMLAGYQEGLAAARQRPAAPNRFGAWIGKWWPVTPVGQIALAALLLIAGWMGGRSVTPPPAQAEIASLRNDMTQMTRLVTLTLLDQASPSERLRGIGFTRQVETPDQDIINALLQALNHDANVNVRLAAIDALNRFAGDVQVRSALSASLLQQASPFIQMALINTLIEIRDTAAGAQLQKLLEDPSLHPAVREKAEWGLTQLI